MRHTVFACTLLPALFAAPATFAHAFLDRAQPAVGSTIHQSPAEVRIWFTEAVESVFSTIAVLDAQGQHVEDGKAKVDPSDPQLLEVGLKALGPGKYKVVWKVISVDTHRTEGDFAFTVAP